MDIVLFEYIRQLLPLDGGLALPPLPGGGSASAASAPIASESAFASTHQRPDLSAYREHIVGVLDDVEDKAQLLHMLAEHCLPHLAPTNYEGACRSSQLSGWHAPRRLTLGHEARP